jgi:hypothetical protein
MRIYKRYLIIFRTTPAADLCYTVPEQKETAFPFPSSFLLSIKSRSLHQRTPSVFPHPFFLLYFIYFLFYTLSIKESYQLLIEQSGR